MVGTGSDVIGTVVVGCRWRVSVVVVDVEMLDVT